MKDVLSQNEIDSLISALGNGGLESEQGKLILEEEKGLRKYDFRKPSKFSKEQMRTLQIIHENFARTLGNYLSAYLRNVVKLSVVSVSQVTYGEFINSLPIPTLMAVLNLSPQLGTAVLETNLQFVFPMIDLLCGGNGQITEKMRELTELEQNIMKNVYIKLLDNLRYTWEDFSKLEPVIETMETNPQYNQALASNETVALISLSSQIGENQGFINICFPFITLESIIPHLSAQHWFRNVSEKEGEQKINHLICRIQEVEVEAAVVLGETNISVEEFLDVQVGDVLPLDRSVGQDLNLYIGDSLKYKVQPGISGKKLAVQITGWVGEGGENHE